VLSAKEIRSSFIAFFKGKGHEHIASSPLVPADDQTLLFVNAGMNQFKEIFLGRARPDYRRAVNSQKCLRVSGKHNDLEEVGRDGYHHTFFEMLGNWSFDDYFKAEAIAWAWELLTQVWGIDPSRLWATVFEGTESDGLPADEEAARLWTKVTPIPAERVLRFGRKDNFWEMGQVGPCGPCSEVHIDMGPEMCDKRDVPGHRCGINSGCGRFIELWNLVFIQYNRLADGRLVELPARYIDTGAGLERAAAVLQKKRSNYDTDLFMPVIERIGQLTGCRYTGELHRETDNAFRVISDHIRALTLAITDGATPSNEGRGYVIRRILRRAARFGRVLDMHEPFLYKLIGAVADSLGQVFGEIRQRADFVSTVIESEEASFGRTLDRGIEIFSAAAERAQAEGRGLINAEDAFRLYDTYGFPLDLTELMAAEQDMAVDKAGFEELMARQRGRARAAQKAGSVPAVTAAELTETDDTGKYAGGRCQAKVLGWVEQKGFCTNGTINCGDMAGLVLDKTVFYAEAGGQTGDRGVIQGRSGRFVVEDTKKVGGCVLHQGRVTEGSVRVGDEVVATVGKDREAIEKNHTATHLLQWALQQVVDSSVAQQGSLVGPDYLRFDFTCPKALTAEQLRRVERLVREKIAADLPVAGVVLERQQAESLGAMALFGQKYGQEVRVVGIGAADGRRIAEAFSKEFCGGTHVERLGIIGGFKIVKEEAISAGVRRITALTGRGLTEYFEQRSDIVERLCGFLKVPAYRLVERVQRLVEENKKLGRQLKAASHSGGSDAMAEARRLLKVCEKPEGVSVVVGRLSACSVEEGRAAVDMLKKKAGSAAIVLGFTDDEDKAVLLAGITDDLVRRGLKAGEIVKAIAPIVDGGGGGRPQMAQAGGRNPGGIDEALAKAAELIKRRLAEKPYS